MRITIIINTAEPSFADAMREQVEWLRGRGFEVHPHLTFEGGDARRLAYHASSYGTDLIVIAGGDGTINEAVNGIHDWLGERAAQPGPAPEPPRLALIPAGTGNDLAAAIGVPEDIEEAIGLALAGRIRAVDVGRVDGRCFLNVSAGGLGAEATDEAGAESKRTLGPLAYLVTGVRKFVSLEVSTARFDAEEPIYEGPFLIFAVGNSRRTGGGNWLTPRAELDDGLLDVCIVKAMSRMDLLKLLPDIRAGHHLDHPSVVYRQVPRLTVDATHELSVNADGEPLSGRRFEYDISPHRMRLTVR